MEPPEAKALGCALGGAPFAVVCEALLEVVPAETAAEAAGEILAGWLRDGLITDVRLALSPQAVRMIDPLRLQPQVRRC